MPNLSPETSVVEALRAAWLALGPRLDLCDEAGQNVLDKIVAGLAVAAAAGPGDPDIARQFRRVSRAASRAELDRLEKACAAVVAAIAGLHLPAFVALADREIIRRGDGGVEMSPAILRPQLLGFGAAAEEIAGEIARAKRQLPQEEVKPDGKPKKSRARLVAGLVIAGFEELFGDAADTARAKGLVQLVGTVFAIMGIAAIPKGTVAAARAVRSRAAIRPAAAGRS